MTIPKPFVPVVLAAALAVPTAPAPAQTPPAPPTFAAGTSTVAIDVVARDKKGQLVKDLKPGDFELLEDGQRQQVESFVVVARGAEALEAAPREAAPAAAAPAAVPATATSEADQPAVIAFVYDRMDPEGRDLAHKAALTYLSARRDGDFVGVFSIDLALHVVQNFTDDAERIKAALDTAQTQVATGFTNARDDAIKLQALESKARDAENSLPQGGGPGAATGGAGAQLAGGAAAEADMARLSATMSTNFALLERDQQGYATTNSLLAVVNGMQRLPGRKTVVFFSQGMALPTRVMDQFNAVVHAANRANVSIYTMDAGGLRVTSENDETRRAINAADKQRFDNFGREDNLGIMTKEAEANEDRLRLNPKAGLGQLANQTGGFMISDTNDARAGFRQIAQDMRFHYVLGYTPANQEWDGRFRNVVVKVHRPGLELHWRRGYFAVKPGGTSPLRPFEIPAVALLDRNGPPPSAFELRALSLVFPDRATTSKVPILVEVPGQAVKYAPDRQQKGSQSADLSVVVRVKNEYQQEVSRLSQHFQLTAADAKVGKAQAGEILFYREAELPPGRYTVEAIAYDANATAASVKRFPLEVPGPAPSGAALSSLVLIDRFEKVPTSEKDPANPLYYGDALVYPRMGSAFSKARDKALKFYFTAREPGTRQAVLEVASDGQTIGQLPLDLPEPGADGTVQNAGALPLASFAPGHYELRVSLTDGNKRMATRLASFTVTE